MKIAELLDTSTLKDLDISGLAEHSGMVKPGYGFLAVSDKLWDREKHIDQAVERGATVVLVDDSITVPPTASVPWVRVRNLSTRRGELAAKFYGDPSRTLNCVGVTGTNGKTSIAFHVADMTQLMGSTSAYIGTLGWGSLGQLQDLGMTTPNAVMIQNSLARMRAGGTDTVAMEVSSHALAQKRTDSVHFSSVVFSNLTREHLDYHGNMQAYGEAKARLFCREPVKLAVINSDDEFGRSLVSRCRAAEIISYGRQGDIQWDAAPATNGMRVRFTTPWGRIEGIVPVYADFALANIAAALGVMLGAGHHINALSKIINLLRPVPGRLQMLPRVPGRPRVIIDYAHTPDALEKVLAAVRPHCRGRLMCVVGCGGERDKGKRPIIASAAANGADRIWLTSDNPRGEDPAQILDDMIAGLQLNPASCELHVVIDRREAMQAALDSARPDDVVIIAGKGHEGTQEIKGELLEFNDATIASQLLAEVS